MPEPKSRFGGTPVAAAKPVSRFGDAPVEEDAPVSRFGDKPVGAASVPGMERIGGVAPGAPKAPLPAGLGVPKPVSVPMRNAQGPIVPKDVPLTTTERVLTAPIRMMSGGAEQLGRGTTRVSNPQSVDDFAGGLSDIARGAGTLALPAAVPAIIAAPGTAALAAGTGMLAGTAAEQGAKLAGVGEGKSELLGTLAGAAGGYGGSKIPKSAAFAPDIRVLTTRGLRPTPSQPDFSERLPEALAAIKKANAGENPAGRFLGKKGFTNGQLDIIPAAEKAIDFHQAALEGYLNRAKGVKVPGDDIVTAVKAAIPELLKTEDPAHAKALVDSAQQAFGGKMFPVETFRDFLRTGNASRFYSQSPTIQAGASNAGTAPAIDAVRTDTIRRVLYNALDPQNGGAGPREIQAKTGAIYDVMNAALRRNNSMLAEQPITRVGEVYDAAKSAMRTVMPFKPGGTGISYAEGSEGRSLPYIRRAFNNVGEPAPLPRATGYYPIGNPQRQLGPGSMITPPPAPSPSFVRSVPAMPNAPNPARALPAPSIVTPPPADTSGVRSAPAMTQPPNPARALPPAETIITQAPPDTSGVRSAPAMTQPPNPRRALPAPGQPPQDVIDLDIGSQFGDRLLDPRAVRPRNPPPPPVLRPSR